ncbi:hypothetical protein [Neptuniibacter sp. QD37_11]|uniref:hypothetical protein n=1 Tax=Neptuniibacter sp. QD37_11 TaxID=3398209 RepID=UPI0039F627C3
MKFLKYLIVMMLIFNTSAFADINVVGVWGSSDDGGKTFWGFDEFKEDGTVKSWGVIPESNLRIELEATYEVVSESKEIKNCLEITKTSTPVIMPIGTYWCDTIIRVDDKVLVFKSDDGVVTTLYKQ